MFEPLNPNQAINELKKLLEACVPTQIKLLIESKHLYQSLRLEPRKLLQDVLPRVSGQGDRVANQFWGYVLGVWLVKDPYLAIAQSGSLTHLVISMPHVKLFCSRCERVEAFNSVSATDFLSRFTEGEGYVTAGRATQALVASFVCQSCKLVPEVFLIGKHGERLTICGRSPMEVIDVPNVIPKELRKYYSDAVVASNSGQHLAANFLMRTVIEQWVRSAVPPVGKVPADQVVDSYMQTLPPDFRERFPSFRELYGQLSADLHSAIGSPALFENTITKVIEHFEARRLYRL